jgi:hypothetical protein
MGLVGIWLMMMNPQIPLVTSRRRCCFLLPASFRCCWSVAGSSSAEAGQRYAKELPGGGVWGPLRA